MATQHRRFLGCIYADDPPDPFYALTVEERRAIAGSLASKPLLVEHDDFMRVGTVVMAWCDEYDRVMVDIDIDGGSHVFPFVDDGRLSNLALRHRKHADGRVDAMDVSLVQSSVRPNTGIVVEHPSTPTQNGLTENRRGLVSLFGW